MNIRKKYTMIDLFSGAGGMSLGFEKAGFQTLFAVEFDEQFANTYKNNFDKTPVIKKNIKELDNTEITELLKDTKVDLIIGGPPCQGFSIAGHIGRKFLDDERNQLFKEFLRFVNFIKPKIFVMENVASLATHNKGKTLEEIKAEINSIGYDITYDVLNSVHYGVPQERRRIFIIGTKGENSFDFPSKSEKIYTVKDAIGDLPPLKSGEPSSFPNHNSMNHTKQMLDKMSYIKDGSTRNDIPFDLRPRTGDIRKYIRYNSQKPSYCVTGDMRKIFHYSQNRALTPRELARIQTFPDDFIFHGSSISIQQQIGNAVPPTLAYKIALQVREVLENE